MADAGNYDIKINQGSTFILGLTLKKANGLFFDLTGYTGRCQIRRTHTAEEVAASPHVAFDADRKSGKMSIGLSEAETIAIPFSSGVYDIEIIDSTGTMVTRILEGKVRVSPEVTREGISGYSGGN
jgi:hypothetical protein